jgi:hypothetical protein
MEIHFKIVGTVLILLAFMHVALPKYFKWNEQVNTLTLITKQILYVHTFFIALTVLLIGLLCLNFADDLTHTALGRYICLGLFTFWFARLLFQFFVYSPKVWRGKKFETVFHILFSILWTYLSAVFFLGYYLNGIQ